jgi:hypothetical protein
MVHFGAKNPIIGVFIMGRSFFYFFSVSIMGFGDHFSIMGSFFNIKGAWHYIMGFSFNDTPK